jgi:transposase
MWAPYRVSIEAWAPRCRIVYGKFHIMQHANAAVDEVGRAQLFRHQREQRDPVRGKRWLLLARRGRPK